MQSIPPEVKTLLRQLAEEVAELRGVMNRSSLLPSMRAAIEYMPTGEMPQVIPWHRLADVPMALLSTSMTDPSCSQLEWMIACHYAKERDKRHHDPQVGMKPTNDDIAAGKRAATAIAFLGA